MVATVPLSRFLMINDGEKCARGREGAMNASFLRLVNVLLTPLWFQAGFMDLNE